MTERAGQGARWPAVSRQRVNPATGRDRAAGQSPVGLTFRYKAARPMPPTMRRTCADHAPTMRRPCSDHAHTFCTGPTLIRGKGFADWLRRFPNNSEEFCSISAQRPKTSPKTSVCRGCLVPDYTPSIASIIPDDADDAMHADDAKQGAEGEMQGNRSGWK